MENQHNDAYLLVEVKSTEIDLNGVTYSVVLSDGKIIKAYVSEDINLVSLLKKGIIKDLEKLTKN